MAEASVTVLRDQLKCPLCLDLLKDPVTIPCGHSFCMGCIQISWDQDEQEDQEGLYSCFCCRQTFSPRPVVGRNLILAELVEKLKTTDEECPPSDLEEAGTGEVDCTVCVRRKRKANKSCLVCLASYCETHFNRHEELHTGKRHKVVNAVGDLQQQICPEHNKPLEVFCRTHQLCVCLLCMVDEHNGHDLVSAAEAKAEKESSAQAAVEDSEETFKVLQDSIKQRFTELKELIRSKERSEINQAETLEKRLEEKIAMLKERSTELEKLSHTEDPIDFLQKKWKAPVKEN
ncbi:E3 ubiquitin/ISG15 ligase TRIM25-like [Aplochiton taeniatus]